MSHDEESGTGVGGLTLALALGGIAVLLLLLCGGALAFVGLRWTAETAEEERAVAAERAAMVEEERQVAAERAAERAKVPLPEPGGNTPVTVGRLAGARLDFIRPRPEVRWDFSGERFVLTVRGEPAPRTLFDALVGPGKTATRIEGRWRLAADGQSLELSDVTADGRPGAKSARLPIGPAGRARVNLGDLQYNLQPGAAQEAPKKD
jgi:hypothetical protein